MPEPRDRLSVGQIALGVFLGNLMFGAIGAVSFCVMQENARRDELIERVDSRAQAMETQNMIDGMDAADDARYGAKE